MKDYVEAEIEFTHFPSIMKRKTGTVIVRSENEIEKDLANEFTENIR